MHTALPIGEYNADSRLADVYAVTCLKLSEQHSQTPSLHSIHIWETLKIKYNVLGMHFRSQMDICKALSKTA